MDGIPGDNLGGDVHGDPPVLCSDDPVPVRQSQPDHCGHVSQSRMKGEGEEDKEREDPWAVVDQLREENAQLLDMIQQMRKEIDPLLSERRAQAEERQKRINNAGLARKRLQSCVATNYACLLGIYIFIASHHSGESSYFHIGPRKDLVVMNLRIDTWLAYAKIVLFIAVIQVIDVVVTVITDPIMSWYLFNPVDGIVYGFTRWELVSWSNSNMIASGAKNILTVYLSITQVDIALWRGLMSAATMFFITLYLTKNKTFVPNPQLLPSPPESGGQGRLQLRRDEGEDAGSGKDKEEDTPEELDMVPDDLSTMQPVLDITAARKRGPSLLERLYKTVWRGGSNGRVMGTISSPDYDLMKKKEKSKRMPRKGRKVFRLLKVHQPGLVQGLLVEADEDGTWSGIHDEGDDEDSYENEML